LLKNTVAVVQQSLTLVAQQSVAKIISFASVVTPKAEAKLERLFNKLASGFKKWIVEHLSQTKAAQQSVIKFIVFTVAILVTPKAAAKHELLFNKLASGFSPRFVEQKLLLSSSLSCYQIHNCHRYDFGHTLLSYLSLT
jgi:hypothetical protein